MGRVQLDEVRVEVIPTFMSRRGYIAAGILAQVVSDILADTPIWEDIRLQHAESTGEQPETLEDFAASYAIGFADALIRKLDATETNP